MKILTQIDLSSALTVVFKSLQDTWKLQYKDYRDKKNFTWNNIYTHYYYNNQLVVSGNLDNTKKKTTRTTEKKNCKEFN